MFTLSKDVASIIRSLGDPDATVIGHGMGGLLGWTAAALQPESVNRLVAISAPHPVRMREAILGDRAQLAAMSYIFGFQRPLIPERQLTANNAERIETFLRRWSGDPAWPDPLGGALPRSVPGRRDVALFAGVLPLGIPLNSSSRRPPIQSGHDRQSRW